MANSPKLRAPWDLLAILTLTALLVISIVFIPSNVPRTILGLPFILFFPGYTLIAALFPRRESLSNIERLALSFGLSLAVVPLICLLLNYLWEISLYPILVSLAAFVAAMCILACFRRGRVPPQERFEPRLNVQVPRGGQQSRMDRALTVILVVMAIGALVSAIYVIASPKQGERFTEFYLLGSDGTAQYLPHDIVLGASAEVTVSVVNHEGEEVTYQVRVSLDGAEVRAVDGVVLQDGDTWEETVTLTPIRAGDDQKVEFLLYRDGETEPYHELHLWLNVRDPSVP